MTTPVLALPDITKSFEMETDASDKGIGVVLHQTGHPLAFISKAMGPRHQGLSTYEKESLAILMAIDHWRSYLISGEFVIRTDQRSLVHLDDQRLTIPRQQKSLTKLLGLRFKICYKQGTSNRVADALSRVTTDQVLALSVIQPAWFHEVAVAYYKHKDTNSLLQALSLQNPSGDCIINDGMILYKSRIVLSSASKFPQKVFQNLHTTPVGGHSVFAVTYNRIKKLFIWSGMKKMIAAWCSECAICQLAKSERVKYPGLLQPLEVPDGAWKIISMDFIEGLPQSHQACDHGLTLSA